MGIQPTLRAKLAAMRDVEWTERTTPGRGDIIVVEHTPQLNTDPIREAATDSGWEYLPIGRTACYLVDE